jgi:hypothetical protein
MKLNGDIKSTKASVSLAPAHDMFRMQFVWKTRGDEGMRKSRSKIHGKLITKKDQVLSRQKEHFEQYLNEGAVDGGGAEQDQIRDLVDLRDDGVEIDFPNREPRTVLKYLKNNKTYKVNTSYGGKIEICFVLRKNSERLS